MALGRQAVRYATVGLGTNLAIYLAYLAITGLGVSPKVAMTALYVTGVAVSFVFNRNWSFQHDGLGTSAFVKYLAAYVAFYLVNLAGLMLGVDRAGWPHQLVQAVMIVICAAGLFFTQRHWVFADGAPQGAEPS